MSELTTWSLTVSLFFVLKRRGALLNERVDCFDMTSSLFVVVEHIFVEERLVAGDAVHLGCLFKLVFFFTFQLLCLSIDSVNDTFPAEKRLLLPFAFKNLLRRLN